MSERYLNSSEGGSHYYTIDGKPMHEVPSADGKKMVDTTIAHARKMHLLPSVTTITSIRAKRELNMWIKEQAILAALTTTRIEHEADIDFVRRINLASEQQSKDAAEEGARIHAILESFFNRGTLTEDNDPVGREAIKGMLRIVENLELIVDGCEVPFGNPDEGFAGCVDFHAHNKDSGQPYILDFKTKDGLDRFSDKYGRPTMPKYLIDYGIQGAAYIRGSRKNGAIFVTVPIDRKTGACMAIPWDAKEITRCDEIFQLEKELWMKLNQYDPRTKQVDGA